VANQGYVQVDRLGNIRSCLVPRRRLLHHRQHGQHCSHIQRSDRYSPSSTQHLNTYSTSTREHRTADCRAQPLRPGCSMGPTERIHCDAVLGQIGTHLHVEEQRRPVLISTTQQGHQNGLARTTGLLEQSRTTRLWWPSFVRK
jgi:hypothetical protein